MPLEIAFNTIIPFDLMGPNNVHYIKVFPVQPYPYKKNKPLTNEINVAIIFSYTLTCLAVRI